HMEARMYSSDVAFDAPMDASEEENAFYPSDYLVDNSIMNPEDLLSTNEAADNDQQYLAKALTILDEREKKIINARWLHGNKPKATLEDLSLELAVSKERVRQIEAK